VLRRSAAGAARLFRLLDAGAGRCMTT
jgi:hypothetical protein